jgi:hypothetical protein
MNQALDALISSIRQSRDRNKHLEFECQALQAVCHEYPALFGAHARTMIDFMWQDDLQLRGRGYSTFIRDCLDVYHIADPPQGQASALLGGWHRCNLFLSL